MTVDGSEPMTPEEVAVEMDVPLEAVREAIAYCGSNPPEIAQDHAAEETTLEQHQARFAKAIEQQKLLGRWLDRSPDYP